MDASAGRGRGRQPPGFTLIELIVALVILVVVLGLAYQILNNCLSTEAWVERSSRPEKIGHGIMSLIRGDLSGTVYRNLGLDRVFQVVDGGTGDGARDEIQFFTTREPQPGEEDEQAAATGLSDPSLRTITAVSYFLKENRNGFFTLYRRENVATTGDPFETGGGMSHEIYDKVKSLSILCFDGAAREQGLEPWVESWDARQRLLLEAEEEEAAALEAEGIPQVGEGAAGSAGAAGAAGAAGTLPEETTIPPSAIPVAVRIELWIYAGDERGVFKSPDGTPLPPKQFTATIPILTAIRIPLSSEEEAMDASSGEEGLGRLGETPPGTTGGSTGTPSRSRTQESAGGQRR